MKTRRITRASISAMLVVMLVLSSMCTTLFAVQGQSNKKSASTIETNRFIIKYKNELGSNDVGNAIKDKTNMTKKIKNKKNKHFDVITTKKKMNQNELLNEIKSRNADSNIEYIQPDYEVNLSSNDTYFSSQWGMSSDNITSSAISANVEPAWEISQGDGVTIAIIDSGVDITHEDLNDNIWTNTKEISGNGIDDDGNGYIDDINGWNFSDDNTLMHDQSKVYDEDHGTHVAGIIGAIKDNSKGIAGVAPKAQIMSLKAFKNSIANTSDIIAAIDYAENNGAKIVNCSWGSTDENPALKEAIEGSNMVFVCAAGNNGVNIDINPVYPASYTSSNVITVASMDKSGNLSSTSNYGVNSVDVAAPGEGIYSTLPGNTYGYKSGTSMAAPFVSGEAALILSKDGSLLAADIKNKIIGYSNNIGLLANKVSNGNMIDCNYAVTEQNSNTGAQPEQTQSSTTYTQEYNLVTNSAIGLFSGETYSSQKLTSTIIPVPLGSVSGQFNAVLQGSTEFNVIKNGSFEKGFDNWLGGASVTMQSSGSINGTSYIKTVPNSQAISYVYKDIAFPAGHKVYVSGMFYPESYTSGSNSQIGIYGFGGWDIGYYSQPVDTSKLNEWQRLSNVITTVNGGFRLLVGRPSTGIESTRIDDIMAIDLTAEFGAGNEPTPSECDAKYTNWFGGAKSTNPVRVKSTGKNLCPNVDKWTLVNGAILSNGYINLPNINSSATSPLIKWGKQTTPKFQVTLNCSDTSKSTNYGIGWIYYDANFNQIGGNGEATLVTPINSDYISTTNMTGSGWTINNAEYVKIVVQRDNTYAQSSYKFKDVSLSNVAFGYEPYKESTLYIPNNIEIRSVGNVKDEINLSTGDLVRRTGQVVLNGSENWSGLEGTNNSLYSVIPNWGMEKNATSTTEINAQCSNDTNSFSINADLYRNPNTFYIGVPSENGKGLYLAIDTSIATNVTSLQSFKEYLSQHPVTITYQLEQMQKNNINITPLICYENGTVVIDNAVKDIATYNNDWIGVSNTSLPIRSIESIYKINGSLKAQVDMSKISISSDGLSFTIAGAKYGEMYEFIYFYDSSLSTIPTIDFSVPTNSQAQITDNTNMINELSKKLNDLMDRVKVLEDNTVRVINYEYDANGRLIRKTVN